jgi:hypothetical protein
VPELRARSRGVTVCAADAAALDRLVPPGYGARLVRAAPDELLLVTEPDVADNVAREVRDRVTALDADALVVDASDGWFGWSLRGDGALDAFAYLSALEPPASGDAVQGDVARVAAVVLGEPDGLTILVPAYHREHVRERAVHDARATEVPA